MENYQGSFFFLFHTYIIEIVLPEECVLSNDDDDVLLTTTTNKEPHQSVPKNQIALLCGLNADHVMVLKQDQRTPMDSQEILAYLLFAASKLDTGSVVIFRPEFFADEIQAISTLDKFILGDINSWDIAFFIVTISKRNTNWCVCIHHKNTATIFFDPAIKPGETYRSLGGHYMVQRKELLSRITSAIRKLYEISCTENNTVTFMIFLYFDALSFQGN